jgi:hypothetical protein
MMRLEDSASRFVSKPAAAKAVGIRPRRRRLREDNEFHGVFVGDWPPAQAFLAACFTSSAWILRSRSSRCRTSFTRIASRCWMFWVGVNFAAACWPCEKRGGSVGWGQVFEDYHGIRRCFSYSFVLVFDGQQTRYLLS